jgi:photosystem II stability/assembly factor-like uncharacterized protein
VLTIGRRRSDNQDNSRSCDRKRYGHCRIPIGADGGAWETLPLPLAPNGTIWNLATHAADPDFLLASSINGEVFCSTDAGDSWSKFAREFGEVHALIWVPN